MKTINVTADRHYSVLVGCNWKSELLMLTSQASRALVIYSAAQDRPDIDLRDTEVFYAAIPDGEAGKTLATVDFLYNTLGAAGFTRNDLIVAIGGGAVTDVSGFVAATWLRGIEWIAVPTTLAGMVDAAVGGKTGINSAYGKNLVGSFYSPKAVLEDLAWLATISDRDFSAGLAEVIKCGFISDPSILDLIEGNDLHAIRQSREITLQLIEKSVGVKATVVSGDFKESFEREILNYGHTFGHAVEKFSRYTMRHGECVAIGMVFIAELALSKGLMGLEVLERTRSLLKSVNLPISLPTDYSRQTWDALYATMALDKKSRGNVIRFVALTDIATVTRCEDASSEQLFAAYEKVLP